MTTRKFTVNLVTAANQTATGYTPWLSGRISEISYAKDGGANPFANGVDFAITSEATGEGIWDEDNVNASTTRRPMAATHTILGAAAEYVAGAAVLDDIYLGRNRVKIAIAQGGASKLGRFYITIEDGR